MSDDWSLKGKEIKAIDDVSLYPQWSPVKTFYSKEDIETLRQKLIEDIQQYFDKLSEEYKEDFGYISSEIIEKIINKRFGVEKNE